MLIPLTAGEARRLFCLYTRTARPETFHEHWSRWRRHHQATARCCHYARRTRNVNLLLTAATPLSSMVMPSARSHALTPAR
jgi:hypothetical protein